MKAKDEDHIGGGEEEGEEEEGDDIIERERERENG